MINLSSPGVLPQLSKQILNEIDQYCIRTYDEGPRGHLGASKIGENCSKALWFGFRWIAHKQHDGSQYRLFQRGHFEEPRFIQYLEGIGCNVQQFAKVLLWHPESECLYYGPEEDIEADGLINNVEGIYEFEQKAKELGIWLDKGKRQIRITDCKGHFGGSLDAEVERQDFSKVLGEFKTQGIGKKEDKFEKLVKTGVKLFKPVHYAQMSVYGFKRGLKHALYLAANKMNDDLHIEFVELDWQLGQDLIRKAEMIIFSETPPNGVSCNPAYYECGWCDFKDICYGNQKPLVNCRSCKQCEPVDNAEWYCHKWNAIIPSKEDIFKACPEWECII